MKRIYLRPRDAKQFVIRKVELQETYKGSQHWIVQIFPEGYGENPEPIELCKCDASGEISQPEGYGIMRIEYAAHIAKALTGATDYQLSE